MATRTKPLISAAALASAAAVAVVSPGVAPSLNIPTPHALSQAAYQLTNITDVLSIPPVAWTDVLFGNTEWGGVLGPENYGPDWAAPQDFAGWYGYVNPWAVYCANDCTQYGLTGVAYLFLDALINGNGEGYDNSDQWKIGLVNYFFEPNSVFQLGGGQSPQLQYVSEGFSAAAWYVLQGTLGRLIPATEVPLAAAFWGPLNVSVGWNFSLTIAASVLGAIPVVGPLAGNSILAYLGDLELGPGENNYYQYGLSGAFNYLIDVLDGSVPYPTKVPWYTMSAATAEAVPAAASTVKTEGTEAEGTEAEGTETEGTETEGSDSHGTEAEGTESHGTEAEGTESHGTEVEDGESHGTEVEDGESHGTEAEGTETEGTETEGTETTPDVDDTHVDPVPVATPDVPVVAEQVDATVTSEAPVVAPKRQRPIRDAVQNAGKQISEAVANAKVAKAERVAARKAKRAAANAE